MAGDSRLCFQNGFSMRKAPEKPTLADDFQAHPGTSWASLLRNAGDWTEGQAGDRRPCQRWGTRAGSGGWCRGGMAIALILLGCLSAPEAIAAGVPTLEPPLRLSQSALPETLQLNDSGDAVVTLQTRLTELGYYGGPISGVFGTLTEAAVMRFQTDAGLSPDGIVGPSTQAALQRRPSSTPNDGLLQLGDLGPEVTELQQRLRTLGHYAGALDGEFGSQTEAAVQDFQRSQGLVADGIVGAGTRAALQNPRSGAIATQPSPAPTQPAAAQPSPAPTAPAAAPALPAPAPTAPTQPAAAQPTPATPTAVPGGSFPAPTLPPVVSPPLVMAPFPEPAAESRAAAGDTVSKFSVLELQQTLRQQGFYQGDMDGILGDQTRRAISEAQRSYGLSESDFGLERATP